MGGRKYTRHTSSAPTLTSESKRSAYLNLREGVKERSDDEETHDFPVRLPLVSLLQRKTYVPLINEVYVTEGDC